MRLPRASLGAVTASSPLVQQLAAAITRQEGNTSGNNPGNLKYAGQPGATLGPNGFAVFDTPADGAAAQANQIALDINRGTCANGAPVSTLTDLIECWSTTDQTAYVANVSQWTGIAPNAVLATTDGTLSVPTQGNSDTTDASTGIDLTDPTTLAIVAGLGLVAVFLMRR